jgi:hypothetical protein
MYSKDKPMEKPKKEIFEALKPHMLLTTVYHPCTAAAARTSPLRSPRRSFLTHSSGAQRPRSKQTRVLLLLLPLMQLPRQQTLMPRYVSCQLLDTYTRNTAGIFSFLETVSGVYRGAEWQSR